jgi:hypothetical protein
VDQASNIDLVYNAATASMQLLDIGIDAMRLDITEFNGDHDTDN